MNIKAKEYRSNLDILEKHLGKDYYKIGHLHIMISQAMDEAALNKSNDISSIIHRLSEMIDQREIVRKQGYTEDTWRDYELNNAQLRHLKRTKNLILAENRRQSDGV